MRRHKETKDNYDKGVEWHMQKSMAYNWKNQLDYFIKNLHGLKVLDDGCGCGRDIGAFLAKSVNVDGIDYSKATINKCRKEFQGVNFFVGDIRGTKLPNHSYDGVWACASILNISKKEIPSVLHKFKRILKKGGLLFISVKEGIGEKIISDKVGKRFFSYFTTNELQLLLKKEGFKILHHEIMPDSDLTGQPNNNPAWICMYARN